MPLAFRPLTAQAPSIPLTRTEAAVAGLPLSCVSMIRFGLPPEEKFTVPPRTLRTRLPKVRVTVPPLALARL